MLVAVVVTAAIVLLLRIVFARSRAKLDMPEQDKAMWCTAVSLADVAALTARWLTGRAREGWAAAAGHTLRWFGPRPVAILA